MHTLKMLWAAHNDEVMLRRKKRLSNRLRLEKLELMPDLLFMQRFRLNKTLFRELCMDLRSHTKIRCTTEIPLEIRVLCALSFYAMGSDQKIVGVTQQLTQRTTSRIIRQVTEALNSKAIIEKWIAFPQTQSERSQIIQEFQYKFSLPGVIGAIACTHVATGKPNKDEHLFFNRKGYHSINVQMICDHDLRIMNVNPKFGGATPDAHIWSSSEIEPHMRELHQHGEQVWLLGDSGYPLRPWLLTPILNAAQGSREDTYTKRHARAQNCIKRCFGALKSRWRCLNNKRTLNYQPDVVSNITLACCVLHNMTLRERLPLPDNGSDVEDDQDGPSSEDVNVSNENDYIRARAILNNLVKTL